MPRVLGSRLGRYEIVAALGAGGMGEVYRARDTRLDREVAVKVLPTELDRDEEFRQRFRAEARAISQLTHPHICTLHDIGEHEGTTFLVMELLGGETLATWLARADTDHPALTVDAALHIGIQIADALAAAHQRGIVHRDLKPGNVMLTGPGERLSSTPQVKLLDFGLAKAIPAAVASSLSKSPTTPANAMTVRGTILGTVHYMAPEQIEGGTVDARSDIFAFGSVLYELLTGTKAFDGKTYASVIAGILEREPPSVSALQPRTPALVDATISKCLAKNPAERWQSAADLATALRWASRGAAIATREDAPAAIATGRRNRIGRLAIAAAVAVAVFAAGAALTWLYVSRTAMPLETIRFELQPPPDVMWSPSPVSSTAQLALAPDGKSIAFVASAKGGVSQIWLRPFAVIQARALPGTERASFPFWSPDSRYVGFFADGKLKKIDTTGGLPQTLAEAPAGRGGTWGPNGNIVFTPAPSRGLVRISADGGSPVEVTSPEQSGGITHYWPQFLPGGRRLVYYQRSADPERQGIYVKDLQSQAVVRVMPHDSRAVYTPGYLLLVRDGMLFAQAFDERRLQLSGTPIRVADSVGFFGGTFGDASVTASAQGVLAHGPRFVLPTALQWRDRSGVAIASVTSPGAYRSPRLSGDEKNVLFSLTDPTQTASPDIWMLQLDRGSLTRLTSDPRNDWFPQWSADGRRVFFGSTRTGSTGLFVKRPSGSAPEEALTEPSAIGRYPTDITSDGKLLVFHEVARDGYDLGLLTTTDRKLTPFLATRFNEVQGRLAPNQRWMAYASDESGRFEVYVRPFPSGNSQWAISTTGGMQPEWRRDGKEIFYLAPNGELMAVPVTTDGDGFSVGVPRALFKIEVPEPAAPFPSDYAVTADGARFLVNTIVDQPRRPSITVILNWAGETSKD